MDRDGFGLPNFEVLNDAETLKEMISMFWNRMDTHMLGFRIKLLKVLSLPLSDLLISSVPT
jgi:hypothetical protein